MITPQFTQQQVRRFLNDFADNQELRMATVLSQEGEILSVDARLGGSYTNFSGRLRSSIKQRTLNGTKLFKDGSEQVFRGRGFVFRRQVFSTGDEGPEGVDEANALLDLILRPEKNLIQMAIVAAMDYAHEVEMNGKAVLTPFFQARIDTLNLKLNVLTR